jgi:hypothetical protein
MEATLQTTALIHEAYLRLVDVRRINWQNRVHRAKRSRRALILVLIQKRAKDGDSNPTLSSNLQNRAASEERMGQHSSATLYFFTAKPYSPR